MKVYIKVDVTKELPPKEGKVITNLQLYSQVLYVERLGFYIEVPNIVKVNPEWFLKEIDLSELMIEFVEWLKEKQILFDHHFYYEGGHYTDPPINPAILFKKFLGSKNILTID